MNIGQTPVPETMAGIGISLLALIALLLLILIGKVRQLINLLQEKETVQPAFETKLAAAAGIPEEDLAVIMAVMTQMFPEIGYANIQIKPAAR